MLKILHVIPSLYQASGPTSFCVNVCNQMADERTSLTILHGGKVDQTCSKPKNPQVRLISNGDFSQIEIRPDIIHVHALWAPLAHRGVRYARRHKIPYLISTHGMLAPWALKHKWLKKKIAWWLYQRNDLAHASMFHVTATTEIMWLRDLGFAQPCVLAPLGSDMPDIDPVVTRRRDIRTVLFVGRIYPVKGLMNLVKAWAAVKAEVDGVESTAMHHASTTSRLSTHNSPLIVNGVPWQLILAGPDQAGHKAALVKEAKLLGISVADASVKELFNVSCEETNTLKNECVALSNDLPVSCSHFPVCAPSTTTTVRQPNIPDIVFTGPVYGQDKDTLYRMANLFVLPSFSENFGVVVTDALSYGVPVITTKGTPWEILQGNTVRSEVLNIESSTVRVEWHDAKQMCGSSCVQKDNSAPYATAVQPDNFRNFEHESSGTSSDRCGWWIDVGAASLKETLHEAIALTDLERNEIGVRGQLLVKAKFTWPAIALEIRAAYKRAYSRADDSSEL